MQKNIITNKITPCCGLPFSVIYWWVSNLTLNSESDRQYLLTQISQNGVLSIDGWKVLVNSGTLEADASLTKEEFLAWFDCGKQPNCEELKIIIESFKVGNWTPESELPLNLATVDKSVNGSMYIGNTYSKEQTDAKINTAKSEMLSGIKGIATQSNAPTPYNASTYPNGLFERYIVKAPISSPNNWGNIVVTEADLDIVGGVANNRVILEVNNGVVSKWVERVKGDAGSTGNVDEKLQLSKVEIPNKIKYFAGGILLSQWENKVDGFELLGVQIYFDMVKVQGHKMEAVIFDENFNKVVTSTATDIITTGYQHFGMPYTKLPQGKYYVGFSNYQINDRTAYSLRMIEGNGLMANHAFPISNALSAVKNVPFVLDFKVLTHTDLSYTGFEVLKNDDVRMYRYISGFGLIGYNTTTFKIVKSVDNGITFTNILDGTIPIAGCYDILFHNNNLFWITQDGIIYKSSKVNEGSNLTWTVITPPLKNPVSVYLPTGAIIWKDFLFYGEYSQTNTGELTGGPKIHRYNLTTGVWTVSAQFPNARHVHSFTPQGTAALYVCLGDAGWGTQVGYHRLTTIAVDGVADTWIQWTYTHDAVDGNSHYPVTSTIGTIDGVTHLIGGADRVKMFINTIKVSSTTAGQALINARVYNVKDADSGETMRNAVLDARGNFYAITAESTKKRLICSPPPYIDRYVLADNLEYALTLPMTRSGEYLFMEKYRFKCVTFESQVAKVANTFTLGSNILFDKTSGIELVEDLSLAVNGTGRTVKGNTEIKLEAKNITEGTNSFSSIRSQNKIDLTTVNYINVTFKAKTFAGTNPSIRLKVSDDTVITGITGGRELITPITSTDLIVVQFDVRTLTGEKYVFVQAGALQVSEVGFNIKTIWLE